MKQRKDSELRSRSRKRKYSELQGEQSSQRKNLQPNKRYKIDWDDFGSTTFGGSSVGFGVGAAGGATVGFVIGNVPGAVIGAAVGGVTVGLVGLFSVLMYYAVRKVVSSLFLEKNRNEEIELEDNKEKNHIQESTSNSQPQSRIIVVQQPPQKTVKEIQKESEEKIKGLKEESEKRINELLEKNKALEKKKDKYKEERNQLKERLESRSAPVFIPDEAKTRKQAIYEVVKGQQQQEEWGQFRRPNTTYDQFCAGKEKLPGFGGVKPFYYSLDDASFLASSRRKVATPEASPIESPVFTAGDEGPQQVTPVL